MSTAVTSLDQYLQALLGLKPPGITESRVKRIAKLCTSNIKDERELIQKISCHVKSAPTTHKLGVLYVIDFLARHWIAHTREFGRCPSNTAEDGTIAGGVDRLTRLLPVLMTNIVDCAPLNHKKKIEILVDIWENQSTFPPSMLASFRRKLDAFSRGAKNPLQLVNIDAVEMNDIKGDQSLTDIVNSHVVIPAVSTDPPQIPLLTPKVESPPLPLLPADNCTGANAAGNLSATVAKAEKSAQLAQPPSSDPSYGQKAFGNVCAGHQYRRENDSGKQRHHRQRRPGGQFSPLYHGSQYDTALTACRHRSPVNHENKIYSAGHPVDCCVTSEKCAYEPHAPNLSERGSCSLSPVPKSDLAHRPQPKLWEWDDSIGPGNIKVLSRTLYIQGDVSEELRRAFVKMFCRKDALSARNGTKSFRSDEMPFQVKWGIGFGPCECCDYESGISVIPINRLTNADYRWLLTAEYGGTGNLPIQEGMVVEEPDIELGSGVSSKVISRHIAARIFSKPRRQGSSRRQLY